MSHWIMTRDSGLTLRTGRYHGFSIKSRLNIKEAIEKKEDVILITKLTVIPTLCFIAFLCCIILIPDVIYSWIICIILDIISILIEMFVVYKSDCKCVHILYIWPILICSIITVHIFGSIWFCILIIYVYHATILRLIDYDTTKENKELLKDAKKIRKWQKEYLRLNECLEEFKQIRREILMRSDILGGHSNAVNLVLQYLDNIQSDEGQQGIMDDVAIVSKTYNINMGFVKKYINSSGDKYTMLS